jgi:hypothetical protein
VYLPSQVTCPPTSQKECSHQVPALHISTGSLNPCLQRLPRPKTIQRAKLFKRIDCLNCPSLRPWLEGQLHISVAVCITTRARRTNGEMHFSRTRNKNFFLVFFFCFLVLFCCCYIIFIFILCLFPLNQFVAVCIKMKEVQNIFPILIPLNQC